MSRLFWAALLVLFMALIGAGAGAIVGLLFKAVGAGASIGAITGGLLGCALTRWVIGGSGGTIFSYG